MAPAKLNNTTVLLENNDYLFKATGSVLTFDGYLKVYDQFEEQKDTILPDLKSYQSNVVVANEIKKEQHFTKPEPRYTESSLIKEMESLGIGRPSTYAPIITTLKEREYVKLEDKKFFPTEVGIETTDKLQEFFKDIINVKYTANMENDLDLIALDKLDHIKVLKDFYNDFEPLVETAFSKMEKKEAKETGEVCPECGNPLVIRRGKYGEFTACSNYPKCKYIKKVQKEVVEVCKCPNCNGNLVERKTKRGKIFYGCNNYPKCNFATWDKPTGELCPKCQSLLVEKKDKVCCMNCDYVKE